MEKTDGQPYEIVAISRRKASAKPSRFLQNWFVVPQTGSRFIRTNGVEPAFSQNFGDDWTQIRVEIVLQHSSAA